MKESWNDRRLHIDNTRDRGAKGIDFWLYRPKATGGRVVRCGICKGDMEGLRHCPDCYPDKHDGDGFPVEFSIIVKPGQTELLKEFNEAD